MFHEVDQLKTHCHTVDRQLLFMIYEQQLETNRLLSLLTNGNSGDKESPDQDKTDLGKLKRPELMKLMAQLTDKPSGFNKWDTEKMRDHLRGVG